MSDNEIIKALKWLISNFPKQEEPNDDSDRLCNCINLYCQNAVDLINRQKAENENLANLLDEEVKRNKALCNRNGELRSRINELEAEIERLTAEHDRSFEKWEILDKRTKERYAKLYEEAKEILKSEAYKEFAERLKDIYRSDKRYDRPNAHTLICKLFANIDDTLEKLTEKGGGEE